MAFDPLITEDDFEEPEGLSLEGKAAYTAIMATLRRLESENFKFSTGGCQTFYSPQEWAARGEDYGTTAELIVVYDGGDMAEFFEIEGTFFTHMVDGLKKAGFHSEECTCWYSAIYKNG